MGPKNNNNNVMYTFEQIDQEVTEFYNYLKENNYSDEEIKNIFQPLVKNIHGRKIKISKTFLAILLTFVVLLGIIYLGSYFETISWHLSAIGRIFLIKLLPYWNWEALKNEKCLIKNFGLPNNNNNAEKDVITFNCQVCENYDKIDAYSMINPELLKDRYIDMNLPIILTDTFKNWPRNLNFTSDISSNDILKYSRPCVLGTNVANEKLNLGRVLERTDLFDSFFLHFQNCDFQVVKTFRTIVPRPNFLPAELAPIQYSWMLWSKNYNATKFKMIDLVEKVNVIGQIFGSNYFNLLPRNNCEKECAILKVKLDEGETLILTGLWNLEYKPEEYGENLAFILETR